MELIEVLSKAFDQNKSVNYVIKQDKRRLTRIKNLINYSYTNALKYGKIFSIDGKAYALVTLPHTCKTNVLAVLRLIFSSLGIANVKRTLYFKSQIKKHYPKAFVYVDFIGVDPQSQGQGYGSLLLKEISEYASEFELPIYLETSTLQNIDFYQKNGFEMYGQLEFEYSIFLFRKTA